MYDVKKAKAKAKQTEYKSKYKSNQLLKLS